MVRAILDGRKTVTRRIVKPGAGQDWLTPDMIASSPSLTISSADGKLGAQMEHPRGGPLGFVTCPFGAPGDRLWVRESIRREEPADLHHEDGTPIVYSQYVADNAWTKADAWPWQRPVLPSIHLPRGLSRITLEVASVRVERLQDITEEDARAEGVEPAPFCKAGRPNGMEHVEAFEQLWIDINGPDSWAANPWVWVVAFRRVEQS